MSDSDSDSEGLGIELIHGYDLDPEDIVKKVNSGATELDLRPKQTQVKLLCAT